MIILLHYFHFDSSDNLVENELRSPGKDFKNFSYHLNAILPKDIVVKKIFQVDDNAHCRFDAITREYKYYIYGNKDPFLGDKAYYFPYFLDKVKLSEAASAFLNYKDFTSFSKRNTQVNNFICTIYKSEWVFEENVLVYHVIANRFLRGMVKGLVGTMLKIGTGKILLDQLDSIINNKDCARADFSVPSHGLFLIAVNFR